MLIDFHTHAFPDRLAEKAIGKLSAVSGMTPHFDGTISDLKNKMKALGVDYSVILNIATNAKQQDNVNAFAKEINDAGDNLVAFGSVHPLSEHPKDDVFALADAGFRGIKLHPDYASIVIDDERYAPIFAAAAETGLIVVIHAGYDFISPNKIHATPDRILKVLAAHPSLTLVCAHMGANEMWEEVLEKLCGKNVYFDTSLVAGSLSPELAEKIILNHDENKILFGSDMPWESAESSKKLIDMLTIPTAIKEKIFYRNAARLLSLPIV